MAGIEDANENLKKANVNLKALAKTLAPDKAKVQVAKDAEDMAGQLGLLVARKAKLDVRIKAAAGLAAEIEQYNSTLKALKYKGTNLAKACNPFRSPNDTPKKDFTAIMLAAMIVANAPELEAAK